jgi:threonine synthase
MQYVSTRGTAPPVSFRDTVLTGLAPDGGLYLPERFPDIADRLDELRGLSFVDLASRLMQLFVNDIPARDLNELLAKSYATFDHRDVVPLVEVSDVIVMELFHGPTLAFKDIALQFLGNLFEKLLAERGTTMNVLCATSGDTGSAAIAGVKGKKGLRIFVLYPRGRVSRLQELQMTTVPDANVHCIAVAGSFDDCQSIMKAIFNDLPFKERYRLGAMNSVNWARVLAQVVYYVYAAVKLDRGGRARVSFAVPTGNFGNVLAGYLARRIGAPIDKLICATNENDILSVFFNTGVYRRGAVHHTISPSMDIQVASNLERFLYLHLGCDSRRLREFMEAFERSKEAQLRNPAALSAELLATAVDTKETMATIRDVYERTGYVLDPHSAVGLAASRRFDVRGPMVCLATAHPAKFPESVDKAVGGPIARHPRLERLAGLPSRVTELPADIAEIQTFIRAKASV